MISPKSYADRRHRIRRTLVEQVAGGLPFIISAPVNVAYLTGLFASNAAVLIDPDGRDRLCTDGRYVQIAHDLDPELPVSVARASTHQLVLEAIDAGHGHVVLEGSLPIFVVNEFAQQVEITTHTGIIEQARRVKDEDEQALLAAACAITAEAFHRLAAEIRVGQTEVLIARRLEVLFAELGADDRAFPSIVAAGSHAAIPHHAPGTREIQPGDLLIVDAGARVQGYHADMTRTFIVAAEPSSEFKDWQGAVHEAREAALQVCQAGMPIADMDQAARSVLDSHGYADRMPHGLGHGIGLQIHEDPMLTVAPVAARPPRQPGPSRNEESRLEYGMVVAVEPGVYVPGFGGVRIEDSFLVTEGEPRTLTRTNDGEISTLLQIVGEPQ